MAEMAADGDAVTVVQACRWAGVSRRSYYYQPTRAKPKVNGHLAARVKRVITDLPYAGYTPQQNGMVERLIRTVKKQCLWLHHFQSLDKARQALRAWFTYYNEQRPHQALGMKPPSVVYQQLAA